MGIASDLWPDRAYGYSFGQYGRLLVSCGSQEPIASLEALVAKHLYVSLLWIWLALLYAYDINESERLLLIS